MLRRVGVLLVVAFYGVGIARFTPVAHAASSNLVIYQIQTRGVDSDSQDYLSVYNNSPDPVDVTDWCVVKKTGTTEPLNITELGCIDGPRKGVRVFLPSQGVITLASQMFVDALNDGIPEGGTLFTPDIILASALANAGYVGILDSLKQEVDSMRWGSGGHPANPQKGQVLQRIQLEDGFLQDQDDDLTDFFPAPLTALPATSLYEEEVPVDICPNINDVQTELPAGFLVDDTGNCQVDICLNLDGLQVSVPDGYSEGEAGTCDPVPLEGATILITEMLPNATSVDTGHEFIELYNPNDRAVSLEGYVLQVGPSYAKSYSLPADVVLEPGSYQAFSDAITNIVLPNTSADLRLIAADGAVVSQTSAYSEPGDDMAWAQIDGSWQYTNRPTPSAANQPSLVEETYVVPGDEQVGGLAPCPTGQYRNPDTNRCRLIQTATAALTPCRAGQERNPATNRCRSIASASASLVPCDENEERNPATNRCRDVAGASTSLTPCDEGQERNPETNRCRKATTASNSAGVPKVQDVATPGVGNSKVRWWLAGAVALLASGYALYEWRHDLANRWHRHRTSQTTTK